MPHDPKEEREGQRRRETDRQREEEREEEAYKSFRVSLLMQFNLSSMVFNTC